MTKLKETNELVAICDSIMDENTGKDGMPRTLEQAKVVLNAIGKRQKVTGEQLQYIKLANIKLDPKDFEHIYKGHAKPGK